MILAVFIYFCAHHGLVVASPVVINTIAVGAVATTYSDKVKVHLINK